MSEGRDTLLDIPTICFGFTLGFMTLTASTVGKQTISIYKRRRGIFSLYLFMIWVELVVCLAWAVSAWLFLRGDIKGSLGFYFYIATLWTIQTQCLLQIIANRVALIMPNQHHAKMLKLSLLIAVGIINVSVYIIWIPARMEVSPVWVRLNEIWDRIEKVIYLFMDLGLNVYFLYLVRSKLIQRGLQKYQPLFKFNAAIVVISISMDALIIGMMSLPNDLVYTQFHSLAYIVKLNIELCMADLISKVVRRQDRTDKPNSSSDPSKGGTDLASKRQTRDGTAFQLSTQAKSNGIHTTVTTKSGTWNGKGATLDDASSDSSSISGINFAVPDDGIVKTVAVQVHGDSQPNDHDVENKSTTSSTARLHDDYEQQPRGYAT